MKHFLTKTFCLVFLLLGLSPWAHASARTPKDDRGFTLPDLGFVGAIPCGIDNSTTTLAVLCMSGAGIAYGVISSSVAAADYVEFRDSNTANTSSVKFVTVWHQTTGVAQVIPGTSVTVFPVPIRFQNGLSINASATPGVNRGFWSILYRPRTATE